MLKSDVRRFWDQDSAGAFWPFLGEESDFASDPTADEARQLFGQFSDVRITIQVLRGSAPERGRPTAKRRAASVSQALASCRLLKRHLAALPLLVLATVRRMVTRFGTHRSSRHHCIFCGAVPWIQLHQL